MTKTYKPKPRVFDTKGAACSAATNGQHLYRLTIEGADRHFIAARSPQEALAAYAEHLGGTVTRMTDREKLVATQRELLQLQQENIKE